MLLNCVPKITLGTYLKHMEETPPSKLFLTKEEYMELGAKAPGLKGQKGE